MNIVQPIHPATCSGYEMLFYRTHDHQDKWAYKKRGSEIHILDKHVEILQFYENWSASLKFLDQPVHYVQLGEPKIRLRGRELLCVNFLLLFMNVFAIYH